MRMIEITENKAESLKEYAYKSMKHLGKLYECIEELCEESQMGERDGGYYGNRGRYSNRGVSMGYRDEEEWEDERFGQRRGVPGTGRYSRYR